MHRASAVSGVDVDSVVDQLREVKRSAGWGRIAAIGEVLVQGVFAGDREACHSARRRANSLRRIANHPDCPYRKTRLAEALAVFLFCEQEPIVRTWEHIGPSHVASVLPLVQGERVELLRRAQVERLCVRTLRELVVAQRRARGERRGRPARATAMKRLARALGALREVHRCLVDAAPLGADDRAALAQQLEQISELLDATRSAASAPLPRPTQRAPLKSGVKTRATDFLSSTRATL